MTQNKPPPFAELSGVELVDTHGLPSVRVRTPAASGLVFLQGAQVGEWTPKGQRPVIWVSQNAVYQRGTPIRGGIPICFPWFGSHPEHPDYPAHGFARTSLFQYLGARTCGDGAELEFSLTDNEQSRALFPHSFLASLRIRFGETLELAWTVTNRGADPFSYEEALHSYFCVADVRQARILGLKGAAYHDKVRNAESIEDSRELQLTAETDRVYESTANCTLLERNARAIQIAKTHSGSTVIWNPWAERAAKMPDFGSEAWPGMVCVECANVANARISLAPRESHTLGLSVRLTDVS